MTMKMQLPPGSISLLSLVQPPRYCLILFCTHAVEFGKHPLSFRKRASYADAGVVLVRACPTPQENNCTDCRGANPVL